MEVFSSALIGSRKCGSSVHPKAQEENCSDRSCFVSEPWNVPVPPVPYRSRPYLRFMPVVQTDVCTTGMNRCVNMSQARRKVRVESRGDTCSLSRPPVDTHVHIESIAITRSKPLCLCWKYLFCVRIFGCARLNAAKYRDRASNGSGLFPGAAGRSDRGRRLPSN